MNVCFTLYYLSNRPVFIALKNRCLEFRQNFLNTYMVTFHCKKENMFTYKKSNTKRRTLQEEVFK